MRNHLSTLLSALCVATAAHVAHAQTPTCDKLTGAKKALAQSLLESEHPYACCDETIASCLKKKPTCKLAIRLAENICRRVRDNQDRATISRGLAKRARSMMSAKKAAIDLADTPMLGDAAAPVTAVMYACARCPFCGKMALKLHDAITEGSLKGKVKLYFRVFPIRSHSFSKETGLGFLAAHKLGKFWEFAHHFYERYDAFCIAKQSDWAEAVGMDRAEFERIAADPVTRNLLVASKKEGIVNKVEATPTFFINGVMYVGDHSPEELIDVLEEAHDRAVGADK